MVKKKVKENGTEVEKMVEDKQKYFWALPIYDFSDKKFKVYQISQKGVRDALVSLQANADWGNPVGSYSLTIEKKGSGFDTKYSVVPNPDKEEVKKEIVAAVAAYKATPIDIEAVMFQE